MKVAMHSEIPNHECSVIGSSFSKDKLRDLEQIDILVWVSIHVRPTIPIKHSFCSLESEWS